MSGFVRAGGVFVRSRVALRALASLREINLRSSWPDLAGSGRISASRRFHFFRSAPPSRTRSAIFYFFFEPLLPSDQHCRSVLFFMARSLLCSAAFAMGFDKPADRKFRQISKKPRHPPTLHFCRSPFSFCLRSTVVREWYGAALAGVKRPLNILSKIAKIVIIANGPALAYEGKDGGLSCTKERHGLSRPVAGELKTEPQCHERSTTRGIGGVVGAFVTCA